MSEVKWIKIATNIFDNKKIRLIEAMPEGDSIIVIWFKLLMLAGNVNDDGNVYFTRDIAFTDQMLATVFTRPLTTIQLSLKTFEEFGMIQIVNDIIHISNWEKYQNVEGLDRIKEQTRARVSKHREKQRIMRQGDAVTLRNVTGNVTVTQCNATDIEEEIDTELDKDIPPLPPEGETWDFDKHTNVKNAEHIISVTNEWIDPELRKTLDLWLEYKDQKKPKATHHYVETGLRKLINKFKKAYNDYGAIAVNRVVEDSMSNNYRGIVWDAITKQHDNQGKEDCQAWLDKWLNA